MSTVPLFVAGLPVIAYTRLDPAVDTPLGRVVGLAVCREPEGGIYLFGCGAEWQSITDTWHETLDDALHQADYEQEGRALRWKWPDERPA